MSSAPRLSLLVFIALAGSVTPALANEKHVGGATDFDETTPTRFQSPQRFMLELKFSPYSPRIDHSAGLNGQTPFADLFNKQSAKKGSQPANRLLGGVEFDVQFLHRDWGNLGVGITTSFYRRTTHSFQLNADGTSCTVPSCVRSGDQTALNVLPLSALFVYRLDVLANKYHFPLVPYFKVGIGYYVWWVEDGGGSLSTATYPRPTTANPKPKTDSAYGGTFGYVLNPGLALQLDFIERSVARTLDAEIGVNHTYLFAELHYADIRGFGAKDKLNLSDTTFSAGLAFEF